jgi:hypothetical protein
MKKKDRMVQWGGAAAAAMRLSRALGLSLASAAVLGFAAGAHAVAPKALDHYLCYKGGLMSAKTEGFITPFPQKTLIDQFENRLYDAKNPIWHCNPVVKFYKGNTSRFCVVGDPAKLHTTCTAYANCDGPTPITGNGVCAPLNFPDIHLQGYPISLTKTSPVAQLPDVKPVITTLDQFGLLRLKVLKPESLNVRSGKQIIATAFPVGAKYTACSPTRPCAVGVCFPGPAGPGFCVAADDGTLAPANDDSVDNFKCYSVALNGQKFTKIVNQVNLADEFWYPFNTFDIVKPTRVCTPVDKNGENIDAPTHPGHLVCYQILPKKVKPTDPPPPADKYFGNKVRDVNDNFTPVGGNHFDVKTVNELCVPATKAVCGNGVVEAPYEECDSPKICSGGVNDGQVCTKPTDCAAPGKCVPNKLQCPGGGTCSASCTCPVVTGTSIPYHLGQFSIHIAATGSILPAGTSFDLDSSTYNNKTTLELSISDPDTAGRRKVSVDHTTWVSDAIVIPPSASFAFPLTVRLCQPTDLTGTLFTKSTATSFPGKVCLAGNPATLLLPCPVADSDASCDLLPGDGICGTRDVDYDSSTDLTHTTYTQGDGVSDPAGSALFSTGLVAGLWIGDLSCPGGSPGCFGCDGVTLMPAGRIGTISPPVINLPITLRLTTGNATNTVNDGPFPPTGLNGETIGGNGMPLSGMTFWMGAANAKLQIDPSPLPPPNIDAQFFATEVFSPCPGGVCP